MKIRILITNNKYYFKLNNKMIYEDMGSHKMYGIFKKENIKKFIGNFRFTNKKDMYLMGFIGGNNGYINYGINLFKYKKNEIKHTSKR